MIRWATGLGFADGEAENVEPAAKRLHYYHAFADRVVGGDEVIGLEPPGLLATGHIPPRPC